MRMSLECLKRRPLLPVPPKLYSSASRHKLPHDAPHLVNKAPEAGEGVALAERGIAGRDVTQDFELLGHDLQRAVATIAGAQSAVE